jgi:hypothetical protein
MDLRRRYACLQIRRGELRLARTARRRSRIDRFQQSSIRLQKPLFSGPKTNLSYGGLVHDIARVKQTGRGEDFCQDGHCREILTNLRRVSDAPTTDPRREPALQSARRLDAPFHLFIYALRGLRLACLALECCSGPGRLNQTGHRCRPYLSEKPMAANLPLAACRRVGHIGLAGDVAEWLKAAVC